MAWLHHHLVVTTGARPTLGQGGRQGHPLVEVTRTKKGASMHGIDLAGSVEVVWGPINAIRRSATVSGSIDWSQVDPRPRGRQGQVEVEEARDIDGAGKHRNASASSAGVVRTLTNANGVSEPSSGGDDWCKADPRPRGPAGPPTRGGRSNQIW
jgi:hypothetical protein